MVEIQSDLSDEQSVRIKKSPYGEGYILQRYNKQIEARMFVHMPFMGGFSK